MKRIVKRFIFDTQREDDTKEGEYNSLQSLVPLYSSL